VGEKRFQLVAMGAGVAFPERHQLVRVFAVEQQVTEQVGGLARRRGGFADAAHEIARGSAQPSPHRGAQEDIGCEPGKILRRPEARAERMAGLARKPMTRTRPQPSRMAGAMGVFCLTPPSVKMRPATRTVGKTMGMAAEARACCGRSRAGTHSTAASVVVMGS